MKYYFTLLFSAFVLVSFPINMFSQVRAEDITLEDEMAFVFDSKVNAVEGFLNVKSWVAKTFGNYNSVLQFEDNDSKRIIIKGVSPLDIHYGNLLFDKHTKTFIKYTLTFDFKDDRFRVKFDNLLISLSTDTSISKIESTPSDFFLTEADVIWKHSQKLEELQNELNKKKRDYEILGKRGKKMIEPVIADLEDKIAKEQASILNNTQKEAQKQYQRTMAILINSAYAEINKEDSF